jgi:hypothetical protein
LPHHGLSHQSPIVHMHEAFLGFIRLNEIPYGQEP